MHQPMHESMHGPGQERKMAIMPRLPALVGFLIFVLIFALSPPVYAQNAPDVRVVRLGMVDGDVQVQHPAQQGVQQGWEGALANTPLQQGDVLATGNGVAEIEFENGATGYLGDNSALEFTELGLANSGLITRLSVTQGSARFFAHVDDADVFEVRSTGVSVSLRERADFRVDSYSDGVSVSVLKGAVSVVTPQPAGSQSTALEQGHMLSFHTDNPLALDVTDLPAGDQFDAWAAYNNAVMMENVNNGLNYTAPGAPYTYSYALSELTRYGTWFNFPGYGWAWQPTVVNSEWVPFSNGLWRFAPHFGFCWISFDRWGWLPFHFGNWVHAPQGWAWIPGNSRQWQPAVVGWVRVGNHVGWVPLAPGDQPNKLPGNVKYGVVTNPLENTTTVLRGPNNILRNEEVKNARVIAAPPSKLAATTTAKSGAPFVAQAPVSRTPPFSAPIARGPIANAPMNTRSSAGVGSQAIVYDSATHTYVNANPGVRPASEGAIRAAGASQPRLPRVGIPVGGATINRVPINGMPTSGIGRPANGIYRSMPQAAAGPQFPVMRGNALGNAGDRVPLGQQRVVVSPVPQPPPMPRPMPQPMPVHPQPAPGAPSTRPVHPAGNAAGAVNNPAAGNGHR